MSTDTEPTNPATYLRETAGSIRQGANAATPGPWQHLADRSWAGKNVVANSSGHPLAVCGEASEGPAWAGGAADHDARHIASFGDPLHALAVADLLDDVAFGISNGFEVNYALVDSALRVARAYRQEEAS